MAASTLTSGDLALIGYNSGMSDGSGRPSTEDKLHFVLLTAIGSGTSIFFTDRSWNGSAFGAGGGERTFNYVASTDLAAGSVITITQAQLLGGGIDFDYVSGEAIYVYQGTSANAPTRFLHALELGDGNSIFNASLANTGLVAGSSAVAVALDSGAYAGPTTHAASFLFNGAGSPLLNSISDPANWIGDDRDGLNALEAQVQTGPWLIAPRIDLWGTASGAGGAIVRTSGDPTVGGASDDYNHTELYNGLLVGGVNVFFSLRDMVFDTVDGKFFVVDSDLSGGHNRILQGRIADLLGNPGVAPTLTVLYSDPSTATNASQRLDNLEVDPVNNIIYFTHGGDLLKVGYDTAGQAGTVLFRANVSSTTSPSGVVNPAGSTSNFFNDLVINFATGEIYISSTRVGAASGGDIVAKNFIYHLTGLTTGSSTDAFQFNAGNTASIGSARLLPFAQNDFAYNPYPGTTSNPSSTAQRPYFFAQEYGTLDGLALDPISNTLYFSTGPILFDHDQDGDVNDPIYVPGIIGRYALGANAANGQGVITVLHTQPGGAGTGIYGDLEIDVPAGKWYVADYNGTNGNNEDSHIYQGNLDGTGGRTQFTQQIGNIEGLTTVGFTINHAPTAVATALSATATETVGTGSGASSSPLLFGSVTLDDIDTGPGDELSGAVVRIASGLRTGSTHQDLLRINGLTSGTVAGSGIAFTYNQTTGALVLTGAATVAEYKAALELVTLAASGDNPTDYGAATMRAVMLSVSDGLSVSDEVAGAVTVQATNDTPVFSGAANLGLTEANAGLSGSHGLTVTDPDSTAVAFSTSSVTATGATSGAPSNATLLSYFTESPTSVTLSAAITSGSTTYSFNSGSQAFNYLRAGQTLTLTYALRATDNDLSGNGVQTADQAVAVVITGTNDAPSITGGTNPGAVTEALNASAQSLSVTGTVTATDLDVGDSMTGSATGAATVRLNGTVTGAYAPLGAASAISFDTVTTGGAASTLTYTYAPGATNLDGLKAGDVLTVGYTLRVNDGAGNVGSQPVTITINGTNDAPTADLNGSAAAGTGVSLPYAENDPATPLAPMAEVSDPDGATDFNGGSLRVAFTANGTAADQLSLFDQGAGAGQIGVAGGVVSYGGTTIGTVSGGANGADLVVTFTAGAASPTAVQALVRAVGFANTSEAPSALPRTVTFTLDDGDGNANGGAALASAVATIAVTPVNDGPTDITAPAGGLGAAENAANGTVVGTVSGADPDDAAAQLSYSLQDDAGGRFAIDAAGRITVVNGLLLDYEQAVSHGVTVRVMDPGGLSFDRAFTVQLGDVSPETVTGGAGPDLIKAGTGSDLLYGGFGTDTLYGGFGADVLYGNQDADILYGNQNADVLYGGQGNDAAYGGQGDDLVFGNLGDDALFGNLGDDALNGGAGTNTLDGDDGSDTASYADANAAVSVSLLLQGVTQATGASADTLVNIENLTGSAFADALTGDGGANELRAGAGADLAYGGFGADVIYGEADDDVLYGNQDNDVIYGGDGVDLIYGGQHSDVLYGDDSDDVLFGNRGGDTLYGGAGADVFSYMTGEDSLAATPDLITDFSSAQGDRIDLRIVHTGGAADSFVITSADGQTFLDVHTAGGELHIVLTGSNVLSNSDVLWT